MSLTELHTEETDLFIPGYKILKQKIRKKTNKGPKIGGGIAVFAKENIFDSSHVVPNTNENSIWIKLKKTISTVNELYIGSYCISPESKKNKLDLLHLLDAESKRFKNKGDIIIQGDLNARTGQENDFIQTDTFLDELFDDFSKTPPYDLPPPPKFRG